MKPYPTSFYTNNIHCLIEGYTFSIVSESIFMLLEYYLQLRTLLV